VIVTVSSASPPDERDLGEGTGGTFVSYKAHPFI
jgi:hypothetical protein